MKFELLLLTLFSILPFALKRSNLTNSGTFICLEAESELAYTGKISLIDSEISDLLLIPGVGDKLAEEIYLKRYQISDYAHLAGMETGLTLAKGIGKKNVKSIAKYLK